MKAHFINISAIWLSPIYRTILGIAVFLITIILFAQAPGTADLKVMKMGLGSGTVSSSPAGIDCGGDCDENFAITVTVMLTATPDVGSRFVRWEGDATGTSNPIPVTMSANRSVRAVFDLAPLDPLDRLDQIPPGTVLTFDFIQGYLSAHLGVNTPAKFLYVLPPEFKQNWILMTRSESLQTGTAEFPRLLLPSADARAVFTIGLAEHGSYPGSHPNAIEFMEWDDGEKNFRFHEIVLDAIPDMHVFPERPASPGVSYSPAKTVFPARARRVYEDDPKCSKCHSTQNVLNRSTFPGTTGFPPAVPPDEIAKSKNKPNWDTYDSWGGMMPLNRDRIYQGSVEAAAFRKIFNLWTWRTNESVRSIIEQLDLQPPGVPDGPLSEEPDHRITRTIGGANDGHINFGFDASPPVLIEPLPVGSDPNISTNYSFDRAVGTGTTTSVTRGGTFVTLHHSAIPRSDEGRGVRLFDALGGFAGNLNRQRIADELIDHRFATATGSFPIDIRPIALAITRGSVSVANASTTVPNFSFFTTRNGGVSLSDFVADTRERAFSMPRRKADIQKINLDRSSDEYLRLRPPGTPAPANGLMQQYGADASVPAGSTMIDRIRQGVFRRPIDLGSPDQTVMNGIYVDREEEVPNIEKMALYRYFLEPLGVSVDKWSMGVRGRSRTYSFADVFGPSSDPRSYLSFFDRELAESMRIDRRDLPLGFNPDDPAQLMTAVNATLSSLPDPTAIPRFTDVQRIFNKGCIECHGGLEYPPYSNYNNNRPGRTDLSEDETPGVDRLQRSYNRAIEGAIPDPMSSSIYRRLIPPADETCPYGIMPCGGPKLSQADIATIGRWVVGSLTDPYTYGDPHIKTVNGLSYDFQAAGEFVLLRGDYFEIQARHTAVSTNAPLGPNPHTGLTSCVSLNTAVAVQVAGHRITYQPNLNGRPDPEGLQLRLDSNLVQMTAQGIPFAPSARIIRTAAQGGIQIEAPGGTVIVITPGWWDHYQVWYLNIDVRHARASEGLMGAIAPGNWLPALPDGTLLGPIPKGLDQRYKVLYGVFGEAWLVKNTRSLFDYAPGTSSETFSINGWPNGESPQSCLVPTELEGIQPLPTMTRADAERLCSEIVDGERRELCIQDLMATGEADFAKTYLSTDRIARNPVLKAPVLLSPEDFKIDAVAPITFTWNKASNADGSPITYRHYVWPVDAAPNNNDAVLVDAQDGRWGRESLRCALIIALIALLVFLVLFFIFRKTKPGILVYLAILVLLAAIFAYSLFCKSTTSTVSRTVSLEPGKDYFWRVIAEDGKGGTVESETRRLEVK